MALLEQQEGQELFKLIFIAEELLIFIAEELLSLPLFI
jgi:hypothetical protein